MTSVSIDAEHQEPNSKKLFLGRKFLILEQLLSSSRLTSSFAQKLKGQEWCKQFSILLKRENPDVIHIHNIHSAPWPIMMVQIALQYAPVAWTLHDCWSFLGSFYPSHCAQPSKMLKKQIHSFWSSLRNKPARHKLCAITPSSWMKKEARKHAWARHEVHSVHNPVPDHFFGEMDRAACKRALMLDKSKTTILCIAGNLGEERKGGACCKDVLNADWGNEVQFLTIGAGYSACLNPAKVSNLGFVHDELTLRIAYNAADLLLHTAPIDNLPNTVAESISCGTPVLAFQTGGLPEMVLKPNGWLVNELNSDAIMRKLHYVLNSKCYRELRSSTRESAGKLFNSITIGAKYHEIFESLSSEK